MIRTVVLLCLLLLALPAAAQTSIHRCVGKDGRPVFSDQPCSSVGATSVMPPPVAASDDATAPSAELLCAKDLTALRLALAHAFALRSANRIGGLVLWNGSGSGAATTGIQGLESLVHQSLVSLEGSDETGIDAVTTVPGGGAATRKTHFGLVRDAGCLWLRPPA